MEEDAGGIPCGSTRYSGVWARGLRENDNLHVLRTGPVFNKETAACQRYKSLFSHGFRSVSSVFSIHTFMSAEILIFSAHHCF